MGIVGGGWCVALRVCGVAMCVACLGLLGLVLLLRYGVALAASTDPIWSREGGSGGWQLASR